VVGAPFYIVADSEARLDYPYRRGPYSGLSAAARPSLLILDLNMPKIDGLTTHKHIRDDAAPRRLAVKFNHRQDLHPPAHERISTSIVTGKS
jgi:CheY-like chemotaxis protein